MNSYTPVSRLKDFEFGSSVKLKGVPREFIFSHIEGEFGILINKKGDSEWRVKASLGHEVEDV